MSFLKKILPFRFKVSHGVNFKTRGRIYCVNNGVISLGDNVIINSGFRYNPIFNSYSTVLISRENSKIEIGNNVGISNSILVSEKKIVIGDRTLIGCGCKIWDTDFHSLDPYFRGKKGDVGLSKSIFIGKDCFIGAGCIILKGINIGDNVIVGAGSVVSSDILSNQVWAGNPAKRIK